MTECAFVDTNIFLRFLLSDIEDQSLAAASLFEEVALGQRCLMTSATVVFEALFTLTKSYRIDRDDAARKLRAILELDTILVSDKTALMHAFDLLAEFRQLSLADCYHAALSLEHCKGDIYTFDKDFRRVPGITRLDPGA